MNRIFILAFVLMGIATSFAFAGWTNDWWSAFDGTTLNTSQWNVIVGTDGEFNNEAQWYVNEQGVENNYWVTNGELKIKIQKENRTFANRTKAYTSARLSTKNKIERGLGNGSIWKARIMFWKSSAADGIWPAFWLLGTRIGQAPIVHSDENVCWPQEFAREIDIWEYTTNETVNGTNQYITNPIEGTSCNGYVGHAQLNNANVINTYNEYTLEISAGTLKFKLNGSQVGGAFGEASWNDPFFAILNVAIGGTLGGGVAFGSGDWAGITVDYVGHDYWQ